MPRDAFMTPDEVGEFVAKHKAKQPPQGMPVDDPTVSEFELGCFGRYERVRIDLPISDPALYARTADHLENLVLAFRAAARAKLPAPTDADFRHERLMVMLGLNRQAESVRTRINALWKATKRIRGAD